MLNILVPTDLSDLSKVAIQYAIKVASKLNGKITLLHVISMIQPVRESMQAEFKEVEKQMIGTAQKDMEKLLKKVSRISKFTEPIQIKIVKGASFEETLKKEAKKMSADLIVMGTRGASGLKKYVMGSNTASIIEVSSVPVLAVPELGAFKNFKNVVYATDMKHIEKELTTLLFYLEEFGSTIHLVHITSEQKKVAALETKLEGLVKKATDYKKIVNRVVVSKSVDKAIEKYIETAESDLLAMFTHDPSFYEKLFDRSITRKMAFQSKIPLLAFKKR